MGFYLESYKVIPKRNYLGAYGQRRYNEEQALTAAAQGQMEEAQAPQTMLLMRHILQLLDRQQQQQQQQAQLQRQQQLWEGI